MPLLYLSLGVFVSLAVGAHLPTGQPFVPVALLGASTLILLAALRSGPPQAIRQVAWAALLGLGLGAALVPETAPPLFGRRTLEVVVERTDPRGTTLRDALDRRVRLGARMEPGARARIDADVRARVAFRNPSPHVAWPDLRPSIGYVRDLLDVTELSPPSVYRRTVTAMRDRLAWGLEESLSPETYGIARALVLGDETEIDEETNAHIRGAGLTHVLAVSGMHVTLIVGALVYALRALLLRWTGLATRLDVTRVVTALGVPLALFYADLAGSTPSAWRAAITAAVAWTAIALGRRPSAIGTSAAASVVLAMVDPGAALSPGFILSIAATAAIVAPRARSTTPLGEALSVTMRAFLATLPFTLYVFGGASVLSVLANVVVVPVASALLLPAAVVHACVSAISPTFAFTAPLVELLSSAFVGASEAFAALTPSVPLPPLDLYQGLVLAGLALVLLAERSMRERALLTALSLLLFAGLEGRLRHAEQPEGVLRVTFLDVGQGDAALLDLPDGSLMAIDLGGAPNGGPDPGERAVVPLLRARRRSVIDWLVITHPHPDHYGGLASVAASMRIEELWDSGQGHAENEDGELARALDDLVAQGTRLRRPSALCGPPRDVGGVLVEVLWPCPRFDPGYEPNDNSLVIRMRYGRRVFLFAGDAEGHAEAALRGRVGHVDVLKVGHHGSRTSSSEAWLRELRPLFAVISSGLGNRYGHPHEEVRARLNALAGSVFRTDEEGGIVVTTDGSRLTADTYLGRHVRAGYAPSLNPR